MSTDINHTLFQTATCSFEERRRIFPHSEMNDRAGACTLPGSVSVAQVRTENKERWSQPLNSAPAQMKRFV